MLAETSELAMTVDCLLLDFGFVLQQVISVVVQSHLAKHTNAYVHISAFKVIF
jgi:hypothetical protein